MIELVKEGPELRAEFLKEKSDLGLRLSQIALRRLMLTEILSELDKESDECAERIGAINDYLKNK